jgi:hypothetical protein
MNRVNGLPATAAATSNFGGCEAGMDSSEPLPLVAAENQPSSDQIGKTETAKAAAGTNRVSKAPPPAEVLRGGIGPDRRYAVKVPPIADTAYPSDLNNSERDLIKAAELSAALSIERKRSAGQSGEQRDTLLLQEWVLPIFTAFSKLACDRVRRQEWSLHEADAKSRTFLKLLASSAGMSSPDSWMAGTIVIRSEVQKQVDNSSEWKKHKERLLQSIAERAGGNAESLDPLRKGDQAEVAPASCVKRGGRPLAPPVNFALFEEIRKNKAHETIPEFCGNVGIYPQTYDLARGSRGQPGRATDKTRALIAKYASRVTGRKYSEKDFLLEPGKT